MKVKKLYLKLSDGDNDYLVDSEVYNTIEEQLCDLEELLSANIITNEDYSNMVDDLLDNYNAIRLEGQQHYIVLPQDVKEK